MAKKILVVDDEKLIVKGSRFSLEQDDMEVDCAYDGEEALEKVRANPYDIVLLDIMLPKLTGLEVCQQIREFSSVPVIMLTAKGDDMDKILGLEYGADDYVTKPFLPEELMLRVRAVLKRTYHVDDAAGTDRIGKALVDWGAGTICTEGESYMLTAKEYVLLKKLCENRGRILSMNVLCDTLWPDGSYGYENSLMVHIRHLREKLEETPSKPEHLLTVRGLGYKLK